MADKRPITTPAALAELTNSDSLIAGASAVLSEQGSSPATPASGYGIVYAKTDGKLYFKNDAGTETDLTATGGGGTDPVIREYTANDTWTKPTAANFWGVLVVCFGAGGGGGSGRRGAANSSRTGGSGGGGGGYAYRIMRAATLTGSSYAITIGSGGAGAAEQTVNSANGNQGVTGGSTIFAGMVSANGGSRGTGGAQGFTAGGNGGSISGALPAFGPFAVVGANGGFAQSGTNGGNANPGMSNSACSGGGGGGSLSASNNVYNGGNGGSIYNGNSTEITGGAGGTTTGTLNGSNGSNVADKLIFDINNAITNAIGTGGGGGASGDGSTGTIAGGTGGAGGRGAGGGGGGASTNGANSGAGGAGGNGLCIVVEYYGA